MPEVYEQDRSFEKQNFTTNPLAKGEYDTCRFTTCDLSEHDLSHFKFANCEFIGCNISMVTLLNTSFQDVSFIDCKMLGLRFDMCNDFGLSLSFEKCILSHSSFYRKKIKKTLFKNSQLNEVDFSECDMTAAVFDNCDLNLATFDNSILEKADLRTSYNYSLDPERNRIKKARFSLQGIAGLLAKYAIQIED